MEDNSIILKTIFILSLTVLILVCFLIYEQVNPECSIAEISQLLDTKDFGVTNLTE